jgi:hypothetical protein
MSVICPIFLLKSNSIDWLPRKNLHISLVLLPYKSANIEVPPNPEQEELALAHIRAHPGISLSELLSIYPSLSVDILWTLISQRRVFTDLSVTLLMCHDQVTLYSEETEALQARLSSELPSDVLPLSVPLAWDGRLWREQVGCSLVNKRRKQPHNMLSRDGHSGMTNLLAILSAVLSTDNC